MVITCDSTKPRPRPNDWLRFASAQVVLSADACPESGDDPLSAAHPPYLRKNVPDAAFANARNPIC